MKSLCKILLTLAIAISFSLSSAFPTSAKTINYTKSTNKTYTFKSGKNTIVYKYSYKDQYGQYWNITQKRGSKVTEKYQLVENQRSDIYYEGYPESDVGFFLPLPIKVGKKWDNGMMGSKDIWEVKSKTKTIKTKAGTFKNVLHIYSSTYKTSYYMAPKAGIIKTVVKGKTTYELISKK
ncbi:hypothetical protein ACIQ4I_16965 [Rummeliibacillus sp. NPDC094406]|uniref:hypothetical protein n=1 Tax=Rummeliibacillus sp. NPDC094406 TaxID=3364511 RepID=UPI00382F5280